MFIVFSLILLFLFYYIVNAMASNITFTVFFEIVQNTLKTAEMQQSLISLMGCITHFFLFALL